MKAYNVPFANNLKQQLTANEMRQADLAKRLGVTEATVSAWCNASKTPGTFEMFYKLCDILNCSLADLVGETSDLPEGAIPLVQVEKRTLNFAKVLQSDPERMVLADKLFDIPDEELPKVSAMLDIFVRKEEV